MPGFRFVLPATTPGTKSPSISIAAFGGSTNTCDTEVGKSICNDPLTPPAMFDESEKSFAICVNAAFTDGSVHLIACVDSWSYFAAPAVRM